MEKAYEIHKAVRNNTSALQSYMTDLQNWETEMKRKEAAVNGEFEQDLPPIRSKIKKEKPVVPKKKVQEKRIAGFDYQAWDKFDVDKAIDDIDMEDVGPASLDSKQSQKIKQEKLVEEAMHEKERGNGFVKAGKWDDAISCYNRAIELVKTDAIYFANRGLCYLKKESLHQAEADCTEAIKLDPTYVKSYLRRATAREKLGSLRAASNDLAEVLKLEPQNNIAKMQLKKIKARMGTKGTKLKSSPCSTPSAESQPITTPKIIELESNEQTETKVLSEREEQIEKWKKGIGEDVTIIQPIDKPPHLRSKKPLKPVEIIEIPLGNTQHSTRMKIIEIEDDNTTNNNLNTNISTKEKEKIREQSPKKDVVNGINKIETPESTKLVMDAMVKEKKSFRKLIPPSTSVQFMVEWKNLKGDDEAKSDYIKLIRPNMFPTIFASSLESDVLSEIVQIIHSDPHKFKKETVHAYLTGFTRVNRFSALAMFLTDKEKKMVKELIAHCKTVEGISEDVENDLKNKYELL